jgi:hypothetical protein
VNKSGKRMIATSVKRAGSKKKCFEDNIIFFPRLLVGA